MADQDLVGGSWAIGLASVMVVAGAAATIVLVHLAGTGRLRRNHIAGIRIRSLLASDDAWMRGHRAATPITWLTGSIAVLAGLGALGAVVGGAFEAATILVVLAAIAILLGAILGAWRAHATVR